MGINPNRRAHCYLGLHPDEITVTEQFKQQGYASHMVGKWHLGTEPEFLPSKQGFDTYYGMPCNFSHLPKFFDGDEEVFAKTPLEQLTKLHTECVTKIIEAPMPTDWTYNGESLMPLLAGGDLKREASEPLYFYNCENLQAKRSGEWKLHLPRSKEQLPFWQGKNGFADLKQPVLFHLGNDRGETTDVAAANPEVVEELLKLADEARSELGEFMQRGSGQRATGSLFPAYPVISHEKDWGTLPAQVVLEIAAAKQNRYPVHSPKKRQIDWSAQEGLVLVL